MASHAAPAEPNDEIELQPFRFLDLPRELRDCVYEHVLHFGDIHIPDPWEGLWLDPERREYNLEILLVNRQVHEEASAAFYTLNTFNIVDYDVALWFFEGRSTDALANIRSLTLNVREEYDEELPYCDSLRKCDQANFRELCEIFSSQCQIRNLTLLIKNWETWRISTFREPNIAAWVHHLVSIKNLHKLHVCWMFEGTPFLDIALSSIRLMRTSMLQNGGSMSRQQGIRLAILHEMLAMPGGDNTRVFQLQMDIDRNGNSNFKRQKRVKVIPYSWCKECGPVPVCICGERPPWPPEGCVGRCGAAFTPNCQCGQPGAIQRWDRAKAHTIVQLHHGDNEAVPSEEVVRDSRKWGGGPLQTYVPEDATEDDFYKAMEFAEAGYELVVQGPNQRNHVDRDFGDYVDSDFDDNDIDLDARGLSDVDDDEMAKKRRRIA